MKKMKSETTERKNCKDEYQLTGHVAMVNSSSDEKILSWSCLFLYENNSVFETGGSRW